jgi:general stress protein 26
MTEKNLNNEEAVAKLKELVEAVKVCMFATVQHDYSIFSRPMQHTHVDAEGNLWFFSNEHSGKVDEISKDNQVYLIYSHPGQNTYVHIQGECTVVNDREKIKELWSPLIEAWFPKGKDDPALCLLKVETQNAKYWDDNANRFIIFFNMVKAIATGDTYKKGEVGNLDVQQ